VDGVVSVRPCIGSQLLEAGTVKQRAAVTVVDAPCRARLAAATCLRSSASWLSIESYFCCPSVLTRAYTAAFVIHFESIPQLPPIIESEPALDDDSQEWSRSRCKSCPRPKTTFQVVGQVIQMPFQPTTGCTGLTIPSPHNHNRPLPSRGWQHAGRGASRSRQCEALTLQGWRDLGFGVHGSTSQNRSGRRSVSGLDEKS